MTVLPALGSVCSGYGGLELGIGMVIPHILAWVADYDPPTPKNPNPKQGAARILAHHYPEVPNLGDITSTSWPATGRVKLICGGTPCQDVSAAGARRGMRGGTRSGIWSSMVDAIEDHRPDLVVWENVRGALSAGADSDVESCPICLGDERECNLRALGRVLGDLAELGYDAVWCVLSAAGVGAPHRRERVFVLAWPRGADAEGQGWAGEFTSWPGPEVAGPGGDSGPAIPDAEGDGRDERRAEPEGQFGRPDVAERRAGAAPDARCVNGIRRPAAVGGRVGVGSTSGEPERPAPIVADPGGGRRDPGVQDVRPGQSHVEWGDFGPAVRRWEHVLGRAAPAPTELSVRGSNALSPRFVEWMMGLPDGHVTGVSGLTRNDKLKALGNGVVPQQAAEAVRRLLGHVPAIVRARLGVEW